MAPHPAMRVSVETEPRRPLGPPVCFDPAEANLVHVNAEPLLPSPDYRDFVQPSQRSSQNQ
jgi:hypothetical protein